jgi:hypothetical protein
MFNEMIAECNGRKTGSEARFAGLLLKYQDSKGHISGGNGTRRLVYLLQVSAILDLQTGAMDQYFAAFDPSKPGDPVRVFRMDRCKEIEWEGETYSVPETVEFKYGDFRAPAKPLYFRNGECVSKFSKPTGNGDYEDVPVDVAELNESAWHDRPVYVIAKRDKPFVRES